MMFKNSLKLFCSNFDKAWKLFFFNLIIFVAMVALMMPFFDVLKEVVLQNWTTEIIEKLPATGLLYGSDVAGLFNVLSVFFVSTIFALATEYVGIFIYIIFLWFLLFPFLLNIGKYVVNEMLYSYMSSQTKTSFCSVMIKTIAKSSSFAILKTLFILPLSGGVVSLILTLGSVDVPMFDYFLPILMILGISFILGLCQMLTFGWSPAKIIYDCNIAKSYRIGMSAVGRRYAKVFSSVFMINILFSFLMMGFGIISAVVFLPLYFALIAMFEMVMFFGSQGMRYYVDHDTVLTPKKLEQQDSIEKTKYLL